MDMFTCSSDGAVQPTEVRSFIKHCLQGAVENLEGQKKWLMGRVFECEVALEDSERARAVAEAALQERDAVIADLEAKVLCPMASQHGASSSV
jgi:hypothetical protein